MSIVSAKDAMYLAKESTINKVSELIRNAYARGEYSCHVRKQFLPEELRLKLQKELGYLTQLRVGQMLLLGTLEYQQLPTMLSLTVPM